MIGKKIVALIVGVGMLAGLVACASKEKEILGAESLPDTVEDSPEAPDPPVFNDGMGIHLFMSKSADDKFGDLMYEGYSEYMEAFDYDTEYCSPAEATVEAQVQLLDERITQGISSITIATNGDTGYEEVFQKAKEAGIPVISIDLDGNVDDCLVHVNQVEAQDMGSHLVQAAVLIALGVDYTDNRTMEELITERLEGYVGDEIVLEVLLEDEGDPVLNSWVAAMEEELGKDIYTGKVHTGLDKKYGTDDLAEYIAQAKADCIISLTPDCTVEVGQALTETDSDIKLTGIGIPSLMKPFMPSRADEDAFAYVCPYMMMWDVVHSGAVTGAAVHAVFSNGWTGTDREMFTMAAFRDYGEEDYCVYIQGEGSFILAGSPYVFHKGNMAKWSDKL